MPHTFSAESQAQFATLSGDFNPIHMDAVAARRTQAGAPVVHGIHALLWLLDSVAEQRADLPLPTMLKAGFRRMIYVGDRAEAVFAQSTAAALRAHLLIDGVEVLSAGLSFGTSARTPPGLSATGAAAAVPPPPRPFDLSLEQMEGLSGRLNFAAPAEQSTAMFPNAVRYLGAGRVAALAASSCLVGMVVPGLYSLFGELSVALEEQRPDLDELQYQVTSVDPRFRMVRIAVRGGGLLGSVSAISRPPPTAQPDMKALAPLVGRDEFIGSTVLVVGGSRGIGEVTAKLVAAGGARVLLTYRRGKEDAEAVAREIRDWGGNCHTAVYDALQSAAPQLSSLPHAPSHVYYFATPTIYRRKAGLFDAGRFQEFNAYYLAGFLDLAEASLRLRPEGVRFFYPSTVYVENRPAEMTEYAMSKAAGEVLCADLAQHLRGVTIIARRLPRIATDQTVSLVPMAAASASEVMLPIVRELQRLKL
jgi:NAD(P)-dependent dehydrogenase (short-subunit alcohol dehydrogenase family)